MPYIEVARYSITLIKARSGGPPPTTSLRTIRMIPKPDKGNGNEIVFVDFVYPRVTPTPVGEVVSQRVFGFLPPEEFDTHWSMLQTEAPVRVVWVPDPASPPALSRIDLITLPQPVGEGP